MGNIIPKILIDGMIYALLASLYVLISLWIAPRIWLHNFPQDIQDLVPPKTEHEKKVFLWVGIPYLMLLFAGPFLSALTFRCQTKLPVSFIAIFAHAFGVGIIFNIVDWLVLDWLLLCTITPNFLIIPGTQGAKGYKNYAYHFSGFLIGTLITTIAAIIIAGIVYWIENCGSLKITEKLF